MEKRKTQTQLSTMQVPCGDHSIFDALEQGKVSVGEVGVYLAINKRSNWESGQSHGISYSTLRDDTGIPRSTVLKYVKSLVDDGWLEKNVRGGNQPNTYKVIHHKCPPLETPQDKDGLPKKCAMPAGEGSPYELMRARKIDLKSFVAWCVAKIHSDWTSGLVAFTIRQAQKALHIATQTICDIRRTWQETGLAEQVEGRTLQLLPKPYEKRRTRRRENPKMMRCDGDFYFSFNERWRVNRHTGQIQTLIEGTSKWRHANEFECEDVNAKIYKDFKPIIEFATSPDYQRWKQKAA
ncbi:hypothetical protein F4Z98_03105 [Candidatus Poribacteria bacterium]|nr:hypothetical protein [Candidatus Poribacteria bacterium]MYB01802.1 hypothetical protein [Candidatus Poribacteria bacterium]